MSRTSLGRQIGILFLIALFSFGITGFSSKVEAAVTASVANTTYTSAGTVATLDVVFSGAFTGTIVADCMNTNGSQVGTKTITQLSSTEDYIVCAGLAPSTSYKYTFGPSDGVSFPTVNGTLLTPAAAAVQTAAEIYTLGSGPSVAAPLTTGGPSNASASLDVKNPVPNLNYHMVLGTTAGSGGTCALNPATYPSSPPQQTSYNGDLIVTETWNVPAGSYCMGVQKQDATGNTYTTVVPSIAGGTFTVGGTQASPQASPTPTSPNAYGCSSTGTSSYCMLAPLPGIGKLDASGNPTGYIDETTGIGAYLNGIIRLILGLIGVMAVFMIVVGGIEYMSTVSIGEKEGAKSRITSALLGLLLALASYLILNTINPSLVNVSISVPSVSLTLNENYTPTADIGVAFPTTPVTGNLGTASIGDGTQTTDVTKNIGSNTIGATTIDAALQAGAQASGVECTLLKALMYRESNGNPTATSSVGAIGLMQMMPATWQALGYTDQSKWTDPVTAATAAGKYVAQLQTTACNNSTSNSVCSASNYEYIASAYNGGPKANGLSTVCQKGQSINTTAWQCTLNSGYAQTRHYVPLVINNYQTLLSNNWGC